jgi:hypothetical protein
MKVNFHVFQQNLMRHGGGSINRNAAFTTGLNAINLGTTTDYVLVAGFTEVCNSTVAAVALRQLAAALDVDLTQSVGLAVGESANGYREYIVVAWYNKRGGDQFQVAGYGKCIGTPDGRQWVCYPSTTMDPTQLPATFTADSRGLAYVTGTVLSPDPNWNNKNLVVAFMHNMYGTGDRYGGMAKLPGALKAIYDTNNISYDVACVLGGDFNVRPRQVRDRSDDFSMSPAYAADGSGRPVPTTLHHAYDFFFTRPQLPDANVSIWTETRGKGTGLSDHAAVSIKLDPTVL